MKKISLYVFLVLMCPSLNVWAADSGWYIVQDRSQDIESYNLKTAKEIGPQQFKVYVLRSQTKEKIDYRIKVQNKLFDYCGKKDGKYPTPKELFIYGKPELKDLGIIVKQNGNLVSTTVPYKRFLNTFQFNQEGEFGRGYMWITCYLDKRGYQVRVKDHTTLDNNNNLMTRKELKAYEFKLAHTIFPAIGYYDCFRNMPGLVPDEIAIGMKEAEQKFISKTNPEEIRWFSRKEDSRGFQRLLVICEKLLK